MKTLLYLGLALASSVIAGCGGEPPRTKEQKQLQRRTEYGLGSSQQRDADQRDRQEKKDVVDDENALKKEPAAAPTAAPPPPPPAPSPPPPPR